MRPSDRSRRASSASEAAGGARFALRVLCFHRDAKHAGDGRFMRPSVLHSIMIAKRGG